MVRFVPKILALKLWCRKTTPNRQVLGLMF